MPGFLGCEQNSRSSGCGETGGQTAGCNSVRPTENGDGGSDYVKAVLGEDTRAEIKVIPGVELDDYSGPFRPDLRFTDFSKVGLSRLIQMASEYHNTIQGRYRQFVDEVHGHAAVLESEETIWGRTMVNSTHRLIKKTMNIKEKSLEGFMKQWQIELNTIPSDVSNVYFEMPDENTGIYTFNKCIGLMMMEPFASEEQIIDLCALDPPAIGNSCEMYSRGLTGKKIELEIVALPPRKYKDAVCCQWKFTYVPA